MATLQCHSKSGAENSTFQDSLTNNIWTLGNIWNACGIQYTGLGIKGRATVLL